MHLVAVTCTRLSGENLKYSDTLRLMCNSLLQVWPALALIGGMDRGLRIGGSCIHRQTARCATLLGVLKEGALTAKVLWDDADTAVR